MVINSDPHLSDSDIDIQPLQIRKHFTGNLLLQTKFRENHLTKRTLVNHGQLAQYHASDTQEAYAQQYTDLTLQYEKRKAEYEALLERKKAMEATATVFSGILLRLTELEEIPIAFDEALWNTLIDHVTIYADERIMFSFMDGTEIAEML